ncbi:MAG: hypothetical protein N2319_04550 [Candidatus Kapabacteria bacterium]|nr:hypothetical protein [Candidatus Kapabacteria bacterium]
MNPKGFKYTYDIDKIKNYMKLTAEEKLRWLEEVRQFNLLVMDDKAKEIREKFRKAEI